MVSSQEDIICSVRRTLVLALVYHTHYWRKKHSFFDVLVLVLGEGLSVRRVCRGRWFGIDGMFAGMRQRWGLRPWNKDHSDVLTATPFVFRDR